MSAAGYYCRGCYHNHQLLPKNCSRKRTKERAIYEVGAFERSVKHAAEKHGTAFLSLKTSAKMASPPQYSPISLAFQFPLKIHTKSAHPTKMAAAYPLNLCVNLTHLARASS